MAERKMDWIELIRASRLLAAGQPSQEALRRAVSTAYYAMFHALATSNANLIEFNAASTQERAMVAIATLAGRR